MLGKSFNGRSHAVTHKRDSASQTLKRVHGDDAM